MRGKLELCASAKQGRLCCDDLCHGSPDDTLCGFDRSLYEEITEEDGEPIQEDYNDSVEDVDKFNRSTGGGVW